ncbi:MAG: insulinase family protein [Alphaproteobacteria bacterium]|nr:insulinase family protein [Alphaproteobacteria bacterium]
MIQPKLYHLSNGVPVIIDYLPGIEAVNVAVYVKSGSRNESNPADFGISHLMEHMALKGTKTRDASEITVAIENVGGVVNAYTGFNLTAYYATVPVEHRSLAVNIIADVAQNPIFPEQELEKEKLIVCQELLTYEDLPEAVLEDKLCNTLFRGGMRHNIGGSFESVRAMTQQQIAEFYKARYSAKNSVIAISGGGLENPVEILAELESNFERWALHDVDKYEFSNFVPGFCHTSKNDLSHTYFKLIWPVAPAIARDTLNVVDMFLAILGQGFGSRLFQEIREKRGLVYSIGAGSMAFEDIGIASIEAQTSKTTVSETIHRIADLCGKIKDGAEPLTAQELTRAKEMTKGAFRMGLVTPMRRADFFATRSIQFGGLDDVQQNLDWIDSVTLDQVRVATQEFFSQKPSIITLGIENELPLTEWQNLF